MQYFFIFLLILSALIIIIRPITTLIHELGHAVPAMIMTGQTATIFLGSFGDTQKSIRVNAGKLVVWFRFNIFSWHSGLCLTDAKKMSVNKQIIFTLGGPLASFIIAIVACYFAFTFDMHGFLKLTLIVFLGSAIIDLIVNLVPNKQAIKLDDGSITYTDGYAVQRLILFKRVEKQYSKAIDHYNQGAYADASGLFRQIICTGYETADLYSVALFAHLQVHDYTALKELTDNFIRFGIDTSNDYSNVGLAYSRLGLLEEAIIFYDK